MNEKESRILIDQKLSEIACLLKEIDQIAERNHQLGTCVNCAKVLKPLERWIAIRKLHSKVKIKRGMTVDEIKKQCAALGKTDILKKAWPNID